MHSNLPRNSAIGSPATDGWNDSTSAPALGPMIINFLHINPISALYWTAVINGFLSPPLLVIIMLISNNKKIMGQRVNGTAINILGWATTIIMFAAAVALLITWGR